MKVTLTEPGIEGDYVVAERKPDGTLLLAPDTPATAVERVEADIAAGRNSYFDSDEELDAALTARLKPLDDTD